MFLNVLTVTNVLGGYSPAEFKNKALQLLNYFEIWSKNVDYESIVSEIERKLNNFKRFIVMHQRLNALFVAYNEFGFKRCGTNLIFLLEESKVKVNCIHL